MSHKKLNSYASKEDFVKEYETLYHKKAEAKELYLLLLMELETVIVSGNTDCLKFLINLINYVSDVEDWETLKEYYGSIDNPVKGTNLVILACKYNKLEILRCVLANSKILSNLSFKVGAVSIVPDDVDENYHNSFYYAIRSGSVELLSILIRNWPDNYFTHHSMELDEILSTAYEELKLKNVLLSNEMEVFVESNLISLRFYSNASEQVCSIKNDVHNIKKRIRLVVESIGILKTEYEAKEVDERFLFIAKFIAQNLHVLKRQLKLTYDRLPWEELEFCLVSFVSSHKKEQELNLFIHAALNKEKILNYLENFSKELEKVVKNVDISKFSNLPKFKRDKVVFKIIINNPEFEDLYNSFQKVRDIHSLEKINNYVKLALAADPKEREGQLIITRVLQVMGEYLKNSLESPKLSNTTSELLLLSLPKNTRKIFIDLRNSLSHASSLYKRTEIEESTDIIKFFMGVQNDTKKVGDVITDILYAQKIKLIRILLNKILHSENLDEVIEIVKILNKADFETILKVDFIMMEHKKLQKLIKELCSNIPAKTSLEKEYFDKIDKMLINIEKTKDNVETNYIVGFAKLKFINYSLNSNNKINNYSMNGIKFCACTALKNITPKIELESLKHIAELSRNIFDNAKLRIEHDKLDDVHRIMWEIFFIAEYETGKIKWIEELKEKLNEKKDVIIASKSEACLTEEQCNNHLKLKLFELKNVLSNNLLDSQLIENFQAYKGNTKLQAVIEMLVLDIMSILGCSKNYLENDFLILDSNIPLLTGKSLRNHLAHYNDLIDLCLSDPSTSVILNAKKLISENIIENNKKIGMSITDNPLKLEDKFNQNLVTITNQQKMFNAIEMGNLENLKICLNQGADINARNIDLWNSVHFAAKGSNLKVLEFILEQTSNIHAKDINGQNPLHIAAAHGNSSIIKYFLKNIGLFVDDVDRYGKTPLHIAAQNGHNDIVMILLQNKANVFKHDMSGLLPLYYAIRNGHVDVVNILLEKDTNIDMYEAKGGFTPLHEAAESGNIEIVNYLLQKGSNVNAKNDRLWTPVHAAARNGYPEVVNALILNGAEVDARVINDNTSLHYAVETGQEIVVDILLKHGVEVNVFRSLDLMSPLHIAAMNGYKKIVKILLKSGANSKIADISGRTPLHLAAEFGSIEVVTDLLKDGIDINTKSKTNYTSLHYAAMMGHKEIVTLLLKSQATINVKTIESFTPLHLAALKGHQDIVDLLIKNNAEVCVRTIDGATPLHLAATNNNKYVINLLINSKADINARANNGVTPLDIAVQFGQEYNVHLLIKNKACVNSKDAMNVTPLHRAAKNGHMEIIDILLKNKADVNAKDIEDSTPLHLATDAGFKDVVKILIVNGANINTMVKKITSLYLAVKHNYMEIVEILISNGIDMSIDSKEALTFAVYAGFKDIVECFLKNNFTIDKKYTENHFTLLHIAASKGHMEIVNILIMKGADINAVSIHKETSLYLAAAEGYEKIVETLMKKGSSINVVNDEGFTPLHIAAIKGQKNVVQFLLFNKAKVNLKDYVNRTPSEYAVSYGHFEIVKMLLQYKEVKVNSKGDQDFTMLHIAAEKQNLEIIKYLIDRGSNINAKNTSGIKPIHIAAREGHIDTVKFFLSKGNSISDLGAFDQTVLHYAVIKSQIKMIKYLVTQGADVNAKDESGVTPIHVAANLGHKNVIKVLLQNKAVCNVVDKSQNKPLHAANDKDIIKLLASTEGLFIAVRNNIPSEVEAYIKMGAFVNAKDVKSDTPLHYAARKGDIGIVNALLKNKGNPNEIGNKGFTPLHYAAKYSHLYVVKALLFNGVIYNAVNYDGKTPLDMSKDKNIIVLLKLVNESFKSISNGNSDVVKNLNKMKDIETVKAVLNARNKENRSLVVVAVQSNFTNVEQLKAMLQENVSFKVNKAMILLNQDNYQESLNVLNDVLEKRKEIFGPDNPSILDIQVYIAKVLYKQGDYQKALNMFKKTFNIQKDTLGLNNKDTLCTRSMIALILHKLGRNDEALDIYQEVYPRQKEVLGPNHTDTLDTQLFMALVLNELERYEEALSMNKEVYKNRKESNHPNSLLAQNNIAMVLSNQRKFEDALKIYNEVLEKKKMLYGTNNSDTLRTLQNIAIILFNQKKYHEALKSCQKLLNIHKTVLGTYHPETLTTQYQLACVFYAQGKWNSAFKYYREGLEQRKAIWGPNHPTVMDILSKLEIINFNIQLQGGEKPDALEHLQKENAQINVLTNDRKDIHYAATIGDLQTVKNLLKNRTNVNAEDAFGRTPLHYASNNGHIDVVNILLKDGADKLFCTNKGNTPLHSAASKGYKEIIEVLLEHIDGIEFINAKTTVGGTTALHVAAKNGFFDIVISLLKHGASYDIQNNEGQIPVDLSKDENIISILKLVGELFEDAKSGNVRVANKLKEVKSDIFVAVTKTRNKTGKTLLQVAVMNKHRSIAREVLDLLKKSRQNATL